MSLSSQYNVITSPLGDGLHKDGKRLTPQRLKVLNLFENIGSGKHLSAEEVHEKLVKSSSKVSLATIYRTLRLLVEMGLLHELELSEGGHRYEESLRREGKLNTYYKLLKENFNKNNLENLRCKTTISVNWLGEIYACDFNQQINFRENKGPKTIFDLLDESFTFDSRVAVKEHCFACTAGAGSSCGGTLS